MTNNSSSNESSPMINDKNIESGDNAFIQSDGISSSVEGTLVDHYETEKEDHSESDMPHDARRVLVYLMRKGSVVASQNSKLFELLCQHKVVIRKHLSELYLRLVLDQKYGVAFIASYDSEHVGSNNNTDTNIEDLMLEEATTLIPKRQLTLYDTLLLLVLRKYYQDRESYGEQKIIIDIERIESELKAFLPITDHETKDRKRLLSRVKEMTKRKVLSTIWADEDRYEITPIIRYVVDASFLESMLNEYIDLASKKSSVSANNNIAIEKEVRNEH